MKKRLTAILLFALPLLASGQPVGIPINAPSNQIMERWQVLYRPDVALHSAIQPFRGKDAALMALALDTAALSSLDRWDQQYVLDEQNEWLPDSSQFLRKHRKPIFKTFFPTPAYFFEVNKPEFKLRVNPMMNLSLTKERQSAALPFENQRGIEVRGAVDERLFFYTNLIETQLKLPDYTQNWLETYKSLPGAGVYKRYAPRIADIKNGWDFSIATAYMGFNISRHVGIQIGHGRHFIGSGNRSLLLSDVSNPYFYLKLDTRVWRFHYQNLFIELNPVPPVLTTSDRFPTKYAAIHYLDFQLNKNISVGFFEATIFNRSRQFELQYLNPVILYRTVEAAIGSPDNVLIGLNAQGNFFRRTQVYGQVLLDEFLFAALVNPTERGWWGNKIGVQAGLKYFNAFGVDHLDLQAEFNSVRPYTYSHSDSLNSYTHNGQPLAHPLWANFKEYSFFARYRPLPRLFLQGRYYHIQTGDDRPGENWGTYPMLSYGTRLQDYGNFIGQGDAATIDLLGLDASWMLYHNLFFDLKFLYRLKQSENDALDFKTQNLSVGLRMNIWNKPFDF
ncbi:MAG: hypothetical protein J0L99_19885 [Chitinophagales bacterium]|nr:hypothetical protein [Chitinophagales bacterium]